jgi:rhodanese-related sulfurtransferase
MAYDQYDENNIRLITMEELFEEMNQAHDHPEFGITLINVLAAKYFEDCRIIESMSIEVDSLDNYVEDWDRTRTIVVYDESEHSILGDVAYRKLLGMGFRDVRKLLGGMHDWYERGYPSEGQCKAEYLHKKSK